MSKNKSGCSAFYSKKFFRNIKYCIQRIRRGYCDADLWSFDYWFLNVVPAILKQFAKESVGYPTLFEIEWYEKHKDEIEMTFDEMRAAELWDDKRKIIHKKIEKAWKNLLLNIANDFERAKHYFEEDGLTEENGFEKAEEYKDKALKEFSKWFFYLWD